MDLGQLTASADPLLRNEYKPPPYSGGGGGSDPQPPPAARAQSGGGGAAAAAAAPAELPSEAMPPALVVQLMYAAAGDARVEGAGVAALRAIMERYGGREKDACVVAGAIPALVGALARHVGEAGVCEAACGALASLTAASDMHRNACVAARAIPALVGALAAHGAAGRAAGVYQAAATALLNVVRGNPAHRRAAVAAGAVPILAAAWAAAPPSMKQFAHAALEKLGYSDSGKPL